MSRLIAVLVLGAAVLLIFYATAIRSNRHPLLIDARSPWCDYQQGGPLTEQPQKYDYQPRKRRIGNTA